MAAPRPKPTQVLAAVVIPIVLACVVNTLIVLLVRALIYTPEVFNPFRPAGFTAIGVVVAVASWLLVRHFLPRPRVVMRWLIPIAVLLSFIPDVVVLLDPADRERITVPVVLVLMSMHVLVALIAVPVFRRFLPLPPDRESAGELTGVGR